MAIGMNATFGNFNPAQYQREDNTISNVGNRFANAVANLPRALREGEQWQEERDARGRAQEARNAEDNQKTYLYGQMQALGVELGGGQDALQVRPPEKGETLKDYAIYVGSVFDGIIRDNPGSYDKIMGAALRVGQGSNQYLPDSKAEGLLMGAGGTEAGGQNMGTGTTAAAREAMKYGMTPRPKDASGNAIFVAGAGGGGETEAPDAGGAEQAQEATPNWLAAEAESKGIPFDRNNPDPEGQTMRARDRRRVQAQGVAGMMTPQVQALGAQRGYEDPLSQTFEQWKQEISERYTPEQIASAQGFNDPTARELSSDIRMESVEAAGMPTMIQPPPITGQTAAEGQPANRIEANLPTPQEATRLRALASEIDNDIYKLRGELDRLERGGSGNSPRAKDIRTRLDDKIKTRIALEEKIFNAERPDKPEKDDPLLEDKRALLRAQAKYQDERSRNPSGPNLYSPNQTGHEQVQNNYEQAFATVNKLQADYNKAVYDGTDTSEIEKSLATAKKNLTVAENAVRNAAAQAEYLGKNDPNIQGYADNISKNKVADLNRRLAANVVGQLPLSTDGHGRLTLDGKPLFSSRELNPALNNRIGKILDDLTRDNQLSDNDKIQILGEAIELLRAQNRQSLLDASAHHLSGKKR